MKTISPLDADSAQSCPVKKSNRHAPIRVQGQAIQRFAA
jgi:hypothetical protein